MILNLPYVLETRRNHALEHATLHILARKHRGSLAGHSNPTGFFILGNVDAEDLTDAACEALTRLRAGERELAIHAGCGTNLVAATLLAATLSWFALRGAKSTLARILLIPFAALFAFIGILFSRPFGTLLQKNITTEAKMGNLQLVETRVVAKGIHRVITRN